MSGIKIPEGFRIGQAQSARTGVTVVLCEGGASGGVDVRGCAPGTRETDLLHNEKAIDSAVNAVVLTGGSSYGLESSCGVMRYCRERGIGYRMGDKIVPLVCSAVIYDLLGEGYEYPDADMGYRACEAAVPDGPQRGSVGAGTGATVGKIRGPRFASKGGLGAATVETGGVIMTAIVAVNACGDVYDPDTGKIIAGARDNSGGFVGVRDCILRGDFGKLTMGANTTIGCLLTNAKLDKVGCNKLATIAHNGLARVISPVHTDFDGDTLFVLSKGEIPADPNMLGVAAVEAVERAIVDAVTRK